MKILYRIIILFFFIFSSVNFVRTIYNNRQLFTEYFWPHIYKYKFDHSQWIITNKNKVTISDSDLYSHMAYQYIQGIDPTTQDFEVPPLGKYLIGFSILQFYNQRTISVLFAIASLFFIFYLTYINSKSTFASLLAVALTMSNWLFIDQMLNSPQMEIFQLYFLLIFFIFFTVYEKSHQWPYLLLAGIAAGAFTMLKFFFAHYLIIMAVIVVYYFFKKEAVKKIAVRLFVINSMIIIIFLIYHLRFFMHGGSLLKLMLVQKWILGFYLLRSNIETAKIIGSYLPLLYINRWQFWSEGYPIISYHNWSWSWPVIHLAGIFFLIKQYRRYQLLSLFIIIYSLFLFITPVWPRYFLMLFVPLNVLIATGLLISHSTHIRHGRSASASRRILFR